MNKGTHNIYVVELSKEVIAKKRLRKLNPNFDPTKSPFYVGLTGLLPEDRFLKHKAGIKSNTLVQKYGLRLVPEKCERDLNFSDAEHKEVELANKLRQQGHLVVGGNLPPLRSLYKQPISKIANWDEYDRKRRMGLLPPQQARVVRKIKDKDTPGLVLFHSTGSGKTKSSIEAYKALGMPADVIVPAALRENYRKELRKWVGDVPSNVNIVSQQRFANPRLKTPLYDKGLQIVDEVQKARNPKGELYQQLLKTHPKKRLLLSGTPLYNNPTDLANVINLAAGKSVLPSEQKDFNKQYFRQEQVSPGILGKMLGVKPGIVHKLQNRDKLKGIFDKYVDYYAAPHEGYPSVNETEVKVPMGQHQQDIYNSIMGKAPWWVRWKVKRGLPPGKGELEPMRAFLSGARQVSNTSEGFTTRRNEIQAPKIHSAYKFLSKQLAADPTYKAVIYSNYLNSGLKPYEKLLQKNNIPFGEFTGQIAPSLRDQMVRDYNANKLRALLISSAGAEGLDLRGTRLIQMLDPHFNRAKEQQIIGRGARYHSHDDLPPDKQNVLVQRYLAKPAPSWFDRFTFNRNPGGADEYIAALANRKEQMNREILNVLNPPEQEKDYWFRNPLAS